MFKIFFSTKLSKVVLVIVIFGLFIFLNPGGFFNPVRAVFYGMTYPFQKTLYFFSYKAGQAKDFVTSIGDFKKDNENIRRENQKLLAENAMLRDMKKENTLLREQLELTPRGKFNLTTAQIIGQDSQGLGNWILIDKGKKDGINQGMPVIVSEGILVGKIEEVYSHNSKVTLVTNPQSSINAVVSETEAKGIVKGEFGLGLLLDMVIQTDVLNEGDEVITSGIGGNIPRGLLIGKIQEVNLTEDQLFQQAVVVPYVKFSKLRIVFVISE